MKKLGWILGMIAFAFLCAGVYAAATDEKKEEDKSTDSAATTRAFTQAEQLSLLTRRINDLELRVRTLENEKAVMAKNLPGNYRLIVPNAPAVPLAPRSSREPESQRFEINGQTFYYQPLGEESRQGQAQVLPPRMK